VCTLSCSNGISELGKSFTYTCYGNRWLGPSKVPDCQVVMPISNWRQQPITRSISGLVPDLARILKLSVQRLSTGGRCSAPATPTNGSRQCRQNRETGREYQYFCTFECDEGYQIKGDQQRSCPTHNGNKNVWSGELTECIKPDPPKRADGTFGLCPFMYPSDANLKVSCEPGMVYGDLQVSLNTLNLSNK
jgi:ssDNA-binding Zn-finger/Zn-ribbon topoisomerase 1